MAAQPPKSRLPLALGLTAAAGVGYYLYSAGGNPKVAEKQFESDVSRASAKVQSELPGRTTQAKKDAEKWGSEAGAKLDSATDKARAELYKAEGKFDQMRKDGRDAIDKTDRRIEQKASEAKSGVSSWFGGK